MLPKMGISKYSSLFLFILINICLIKVNGSDTKNILTSLEVDELLKFNHTKYSNWTKNDIIQYNSSQSYDARGMGPLYNLTNKVIEIFVGIEEPIPDGYIVVTENNFALGAKAENNDWTDLLKAYWGVLLVVTISLVLIVFMPIIGLCFCCCRCAGACGGRSQPFDKKHDTCRRFLLGVLIICAATGILFGVVICFSTNFYMQQGIGNLTTSARYGVEDTQKFLKKTSSEVNHLLIENYDELNKNLVSVLEESGKVLIDKLGEASKSISFKKLNEFVITLPSIKSDLEEMKILTNRLRSDATQLNDGLRMVKNSLLFSLTNCSQVRQECSEILSKYKIGQLDNSGIDYNKLPDVSEIIVGVDDLIENKIMDTIQQGETALNDLESKLTKTINDNTPSIKLALNETGKGIKDIANGITKTFEKLADVAGNNTYKHFDAADEYINEYSNYSYYFGIAVSSVILLVLLCIVFGLLCGVCGKRPDGYGDDCCNKGAGGRFLMFSVALIFLFISLLALITIVYFLVGLVMYRGVCTPLKNPENDQLITYIDSFINLNKLLYPNTKKTSLKYDEINSQLLISNIITSCHENKAIYNVLKINNYFDINKIKEFPIDYEIYSKMDELTATINIASNITILKDGMEEDIKKLATSSLSEFNGDRFIDNLNDNVTQSNLNEIAAKLDETTNVIQPSEAMNPVKSDLKLQALHLRSYQENLVKPMISNSGRLVQLANNLQNSLKFDEVSFETAIMKLLNEIKEAEEFFQTNGTHFVQDLAKKLMSGFVNEINTYLDLVVTTVEKDVGQCAPLSNVYSSLVVATCNRIVDPFNGFWAGIGWSILIFLPTIIIAVKLSTLYQKSDPYPGPLVESEYLYDAYTERDNIPLANGPNNKKRNKNPERRRGSRDRETRHHGDYYEDSSSSHGPIQSSSREARYNDMAPKHWDGGPPRYQNPPMAPPATEYERPPPYYFPGAAPAHDE